MFFERQQIQGYDILAECTETGNPHVTNATCFIDDAADMLKDGYHLNDIPKSGYCEKCARNISLKIRPKSSR